MEREELPKLPQARKFLRAARWGFDDLLANHRDGREFVFFVIGIVTIIRAVPQVLLNHDRHLSPDHERLIGAWAERTRDWQSIPELSFLH